MADKARSFAVIGLGTFGGTVATELARFGNRVLGIDISEPVAGRFADTLAQVLIADGKDENALREAGLEHYDVAIVAIGEDLEANILCAMNARLLGVETIWAKAMSRTHHRILSKLGVDRVIHPEQEIGQRIAQVLNNPMIRDYVSLGNGYNLVNVLVPERLAGRSVGELKLTERFEVRAIGLMRGTEPIWTARLLTAPCNATTGCCCWASAPTCDVSRTVSDHGAAASETTAAPGGACGR